jgi:spermidine synthase
MKFVLSRRRAIGQLLGVACAAQVSPAFAQVAGEVARRESQYATTYVVREGKYLTMRFGINQCIFTESRYNPADPAELPIVYTQYMTAALAYVAKPSRVVEIGMGGGRLASYVHDFVPSTHITCLELDPGVVDLAKRYFGVKPGPRLELVNRDGRVYMASTKRSFDIIMVDAYQGTLVPFHLVTREFFTILKRKLAPGGVVAQNISPTVLDLHRIAATARAIFDHVDLFPARNNWVLMAYDGPVRTDAQLIARAGALQEAHGLRYPLKPMIAERYEDARTGKDDARPFTDDFAPVGYSDYDRKCRVGGG